MRANRQCNGGLTPQASFLRNVRAHSTPLNVNGANSFNRNNNSNKKRAKKRKLSDGRIIDLTPKKARLSSNDSDVEIIEPEPPTIIDLVADEVNSCNALIMVNATAESTTISDNKENQNANSIADNSSVNNDVSIIVDSAESTDLLGTSMEAPNVIETKQSNIEPVPLFVRDSSGGGSLVPPLYDLVSDDSFCFDSPFATPISSQDFSFSNKTLTNGNVEDSVIFVSETIMPRRKVPPLPQSDDFISINNRGGFNRLVSSNRGYHVLDISFLQNLRNYFS